MKRLTFTGYSDDTFACTAPGIDVDYDTCASGRPVTMRVEAGGERLLVVGQYAPGACQGWLVGIAPDEGADPDGPMPAWPARFVVNYEVPYSPKLELMAPDDVRVTLVGAP